MVETPIEPAYPAEEWDAGWRARRLARETQDFIEDQPETSGVIATLLGLVLGLLLGR